MLDVFATAWVLCALGASPMASAADAGSQALAMVDSAAPAAEPRSGGGSESGGGGARVDARPGRLLPRGALDAGWLSRRPAREPTDAGLVTGTTRDGPVPSSRPDAGSPAGAPGAEGGAVAVLAADRSADAGSARDAGSGATATRGGAGDGGLPAGAAAARGAVDGGLSASAAPPDAGLADSRAPEGPLDAGRSPGATAGGLGLAGALAADAGSRPAAWALLSRPDAGVDAGRPESGPRGATFDTTQGDAGLRATGEAAFIFFPSAPSAVDATVLPEAPLEGPTASLFKYALQQQVERDRERAAAQKSLVTVNAALERFFKTSGGQNPRLQRDELARLAEAELEKGRLAALATADHERRRLSWVVKALRDAERNKAPTPIPGADLALLTERQAAVRDGRVRNAIEARIKGYRGLLLGIIAWVDGDTFASLEHLKAGVAGIPDHPLAHLYLGSLHYILEHVNDALDAWRHAFDLDPDNETIRKLLADHLHERK